MDSHYVSTDQALQRFGLSAFRPGQREVIEAIAAGHDCLCVMPTGGGKSLCYQLPSLIRPGLTIVVSPLIALMKDQVDSLGRHGIPAALINSTLSHSEQQSRLQDVAAGKYQLVYVAPERLRNPRFLEAIRATPIQLLAIDEAHCISQWGHDFRPDYTRIGEFRQWLGGVQTVALTATATPRVRQDIMDVLGLKKPRQFMSGFARPNLHFGVVHCQSDRDKDQELEQFLRTNPGAGIIYAATRKRCEALVDWIGQTLKLPVGAYHAGLQQDQRRVIQERFMSNQLKLIVATNAFGMGIDKSDLRFVLHYNMPGSLEAYYQEAGRAGRDGKDSLAVMLYSMQDRYIQEYFIENNYPSREVIQSVYEYLIGIEDDPIEMTLEEIRDQMGASVSPESIGSCLQILARTRVLERLEMGGGLAMIRIDSDLPTLVDMFPTEAKVRRQVMRLLERVVGDRRYEDVYVHPRWLLQESGMERDAMVRALREIGKLDEVDYVPPFRGRAIHFRKRDVPFAELGIDFVTLKKRMDAEYDRLNQVVQYAQSPICRQASILKYFGDPDAKSCCQCDRCRCKPGWPSFKLDSHVSNQNSPTSPTTTQQRGEQLQQVIQANPKLAKVVSAQDHASSGVSVGSQPSNADQIAFLNQILDAVARVHGRLGKHLIAQYLCGSSNSKVQKLNLHRLSGFGLLKGFRQEDGVQLLDVMLAAGLLRQEEVNRNRPTVSVSPQLTDLQLRQQLLQTLELPNLLRQKISRIQSNKPSTATASVPTPKAAGESPGQSATAQPSATTHLSKEQPESSSSLPDWHWTIELFRRGFDWEAIQAIRRLTDQEVAASLCGALAAGETIERGWLISAADGLRSVGQQRVVRELQRRSSAGV